MRGSAMAVSPGLPLSSVRTGPPAPEPADDGRAGARRRLRNLRRCPPRPCRPTGPLGRQDDPRQIDHKCRLSDRAARPMNRPGGTRREDAPGCFGDEPSSRPCPASILAVSTGCTASRPGTRWRHGCSRSRKLAEPQTGSTFSIRRRPKHLVPSSRGYRNGLKTRDDVAGRGLPSLLSRARPLVPANAPPRCPAACSSCASAPKETGRRAGRVAGDRADPWAGRSAESSSKVPWDRMEGPSHAESPRDGGRHPRDPSRRL